MKDEVVCFVPIRLNSVRVKQKSILNVAGRPMFCWSLSTLDKLGIPVYVYSSDIKKLKEKIDFEFKNIIFLNRPEFLDADDTVGLDIYKEFSKQVESDVYLLAHCTSPFVTLETYKKCIQAVLEGSESSLTVKKEQTFVWYKKEKLNFSIPRLKTQEIEPVYIETSAAYCYRKHTLENNSRSCDNPCLIMTEGLETIDIDEKSDLELIRSTSTMKRENV